MTVQFAERYAKLFMLSRERQNEPKPIMNNNE